jgi:NTP pyrophosphatase (non-canonical NTP hydrolase)
MITQQDLDDMGMSYYTPPQTYQTPMDMVKEFSRVLDQKPDPVLYIKLILEEFSEFWDEVEEAHRDYQLIDPAKALKELADLVYVCYGYANAMGYNLDEALRRVHENNLGRCLQPDGSVKRRADGKILKNEDYPKVKLDDLMGQPL